MDKNHGPPAFKGKWSPEYDTLENNELLKTRGLNPSDVRHPNHQARIESGEASVSAV